MVQVTVWGDKTCLCTESPAGKPDAAQGKQPFAYYLDPLITGSPYGHWLSSTPTAGLSTMGLASYPPYPQFPYRYGFPLLSSGNSDLFSLALSLNAWNSLSYPSSYSYSTGWGTKLPLGGSSFFDLRL